MMFVSTCISSVQLLMLLLLALVMDFTDGSQSCIFDALRPDQVPSSNVVYSWDSRPFREQGTSSRRLRRQALPDELFAPIRVASFFYEMELESDEKEELKSVINKSVVQIEKIFSVIPVSGTLRLNRTGCRRTYQTGNNTGKCSFVPRSYTGEMCANEFQIPDDHLEGLFLWDDSNPNPIQTIFHEGRGVSGTDFILYAQSISSSRCNSAEQNIIAYATFCYLDQNGRPIAAYINICPQMIRDRSNKLSVTVLHELFHALGFSSNLFSYFKRCFLTDSGSVMCHPRNRIVRFSNGAQRLVTDRVAEMTSRHLNCPMNETARTFGAILQTERGEVMSHWDAAFLQGSLMMPTIAEPHLMFIDNITLALFEDSGWYKVNYSHAQNFRWGKGEGCDFGLDSNCQDRRSPFFCQQSDLIGCHYLRRDKARCESNPFLHGCSIYDPKPEDSCLDSTLQQSSNSDSSFGESFGPSSRCFRANLSRDEEESMQPLEGRCLKHRCNETNHLFVGIDNDWIFCPAGTLLQVTGLHGVIECPAEHVLCTEPWPLVSSTPHPFTSGSSSSTDRGTLDDVLWLEMSFDSLPANDNNNDSNSEEMEQLKEQLRQRIRLTLATRNDTWNISNVTLIYAGHLVQFALTTSGHHQSKDDMLAVMELLRREVDAGNFSFSFSGSAHTAKSIRLLYVSGGYHSTPTTSLSPLLTVSQLPLSHIVSSGLVSAIAIGSVVGFAIVAIVVVLFARCCLARQRKKSQSLSTEPSFQASVV